jgi:hypothetical protein
VAHLTPAPPGVDPFGRPPFGTQEPIEGTEGDSEEWKSWELERIVDKRFTKYGNKNNLEYLVKYKGYGNEWNEWQPVEALGNAQDLVNEYEQRLAQKPAEQKKSKAHRDPAPEQVVRKRGRPRKDASGSRA